MSGKPINPGNLLGEETRPCIMAVLNVTPDSFSDGGHVHHNGRLDFDRVRRRVAQMLAEGADIIDVGGESTRPGAAPVSEQAELDRVISVVEAIISEFDASVSVDTSTAIVIQEAARAGAAMINDVRALSRPGALGAVAATDLPVCLMHMVGEPGTMQANPNYNDIVAEVLLFLQERVGACTQAGISRERIVLDPGFGFGKSLQHNIELFKGLPELAGLGFPVMVGVSRKTMVGAILDRGVPERMVGSVALAMLAVQSGAKIIRVHDVAATSDALKILAAVS
ncbi:MAG: dihydropteroate synthase [Porticoccaceae bacterium]|nr:dihydropteroate synthase [Pseudomonadales bacterium]